MRVLVAGGGVAALETVLALRALAGSRVSVELVAPGRGFVDRPGSVAGAFGFGAAGELSLESIARRERLALHGGAIVRVDVEDRAAFTRDGLRLPYDALVLAVGAHARPAVPGSTTFTGPIDVPALEAVVERARRGELRELVFAAPAGATGSLPLYELAIMAAVTLHGRGARITVVTPERQPLWLFGPAAGEALARMLAERGVHLRTGAIATAVEDGRLGLAGGASVDADAVVALPVLTGPGIDGLPADARGFLPVDAHGRVQGAPGVYAAGDATTFPIKQGGLATQQADAVAEAIAATAGAPEEPHPFRPVASGLLLTGGAPLYLRAELSAAGDVVAAGSAPVALRGEASTHALWWPPGKVAGRFLAPYLATARPPALDQAPLQDRTPLATTHPSWYGEDAFALAVLVADEDARRGDFAQALHALDAAAALHGGALPADVEQRRIHWAQRASVGGAA